jgi:hypothetical protein
MVWPPGMCEACYEPQWSDALHDWEFVEDGAGPCGACQVLPMDVARVLDGMGAQAEDDALLGAVASGAGSKNGSR